MGMTKNIVLFSLFFCLFCEGSVNNKLVPFDQNQLHPLRLPDVRSQISSYLNPIERLDFLLTRRDIYSATPTDEIKETSVDARCMKGHNRIYSHTLDRSDTRVLKCLHADSQAKDILPNINICYIYGCSWPTCKLKKSSHKTPLFIASKRNNYDELKFLIEERKAQLTAIDGRDPDVWRLFFNGVTTINSFELLWKNGFNFSLPVHHGLSPLVLAIHERYVERVESLLAYGANPNEIFSIIENGKIIKVTLLSYLAKQLITFHLDKRALERALQATLENKDQLLSKKWFSHQKDLLLIGFLLRHGGNPKMRPSQKGKNCWEILRADLPELGLDDFIAVVIQEGLDISWKQLFCTIL
jgi:hypothetical protein